MCIFVVWMDRETAKLFQFSSEKMERKVLKSSHVDHHTHRTSQFDVQRREWGFFEEVARSIESATRILILGPGLAKHQFLTYLAEHHPFLAKKIAGCETVDHPTDAQIAAIANRFFVEAHSQEHLQDVQDVNATKYKTGSG